MRAIGAVLAGMLVSMVVGRIWNALRASRTGVGGTGPHRIYPPMDPDDPLGLTVGDCGPTQPRRDAHRCTPGCNPGNCPRQDF